MKTYPVLFAIEHGTTDKDQKRYEPGSTIDLEDAEAEPLAAVGAIGEPVKKAAKSAS